MSRPRVSTGTITVQDVDVDGRAHAKLELADPGLLVALSAALHEGDPLLPPTFRALAAHQDPVLVESTATSLLGNPAVRAAMTLVLTPEAARDLMDDLDDVLHTVYFADDEDPL